MSATHTDEAPISRKRELPGESGNELAHQTAARYLRETAELFRSLATTVPDSAESWTKSAETYDEVAGLVERSPIVPSVHDFGRIHSNAAIAVSLLRDAARFFDTINGAGTASFKERAREHRDLAHLLETDPMAPIAPAPPAPSLESSPRPSASNAPVRVFISSTFLDMQAERDELVNQTFPNLRRHFRARGVQPLEIDLRWGISNDEVDQGRLLALCLGEIERCRPFFIGLLGERYGTVIRGDAISEDLKSAFPSLVHAADSSITELEILQGGLWPRPSDTALFFERVESDRDHSPSPEDQQQRLRQADLKRRIRDVGATVVEYRSPEELGSKVEDSMRKLLLERLPQPSSADSLDVELHAAYTEERTHSYVEVGDHLDAIEAWYSNQAQPVLLLRGAPGLGKTALAAAWARRHRATHPKDIVFEHYVGAAASSADPVQLVSRLWRYLDRETGATVPMPSERQGNHYLGTLLEQRLALAARYVRRLGAHLIILIDGLDKLDRSHEFRWFPHGLADGIKLLGTSGESTRVDAVANERHWQSRPLSHLILQERQPIVESTLRHWGRSLAQHRIELLVRHPLGGVPLFLRSVLDELRFTVNEARFDERLRHYLTASSMEEFYTLVLERLERDCSRDFVEQSVSLLVLSEAGLEEAFIRETNGARPFDWSTLRNALGSSVFERQGRLSIGTTYLVRAAVRRYLVRQDAEQAHRRILIARLTALEPDAHRFRELLFQTRALEDWRALEALLLDLDEIRPLLEHREQLLSQYWAPLRARGIEPARALCAKFGERFGAATNWHDAELEFAGELADWFLNARATSPELSKLNEDIVAASARLRGLDSGEHARAQSRIRINSLAVGDLEGARSRQQQLLQERKESSSKPDDDLYDEANLGAALMVGGRFAEAEAVLEPIVREWGERFGKHHKNWLVAAGNLAEVYRHQDKLKLAIDLQSQVLSGRIRLFGEEDRDTLTAQMNLALALSAHGMYEAAEPQLEAVWSTANRRFGMSDELTIICATNWASCKRHRGDLKGAARLERWCLEVKTRTLGPQNPSTLIGATNLANTLLQDRQPEEARKLLEPTFAGLEATLGKTHPDTLATALSLGAAYSAGGDPGAAEKIYLEVVDIATAQYGPTASLALSARAGLATIAFDRGDEDEAVEIQQTVVDGLTSVFGKENPETQVAQSSLDLLRAARLRIPRRP